MTRLIQGAGSLRSNVYATGDTSKGVRNFASSDRSRGMTFAIYFCCIILRRYINSSYFERVAFGTVMRDDGNSPAPDAKMHFQSM